MVQSCNIEKRLAGVVATVDLEEAVKGVDIAVMVGGFPRKAGMERKDVMSKNVSIYQSQAAALEKGANKGVKVHDHLESLWTKKYSPSSRLGEKTFTHCSEGGFQESNLGPLASEARILNH